jgi:large subunit ribosomal protein L25
METISLTAAKRGRLGKGGSRALRREGGVPVVLYGRGREALSLSIPELALRHVIGEARHSVIALDLGADGIEHAVVKQIQRHPVRHQILHLDLLAIDMEQDVELPVSIELRGEPAGVGEGGVLDHQLREVTVRARPDRIPPAFQVDVSGLEIGEQIAVAQLPVSPGVEILDDPDTLIASVLTPQPREEEVGLPEGELPEEIGAEAAAEKREEPAPTGEAGTPTEETG